MTNPVIEAYCPRCGQAVSGHTKIIDIVMHEGGMTIRLSNVPISHSCVRIQDQ